MALRKAGLEAWGADSGAPPVAEELRPFVFPAQDAFALPEELRRRVDVVLLLDVLEHLQAPAEFLARCRHRFPRSSRLVVTVPARAELWSNYDRFYGHFLRYDRASLSAVLSSLEGGRIETGYFFHLLYVVLSAQLLFSRVRPIRNAPPTAPRLHRLVGRIFDYEQRWLPARWWGTSLWDGSTSSGRRSGADALTRRKGRGSGCPGSARSSRSPRAGAGAGSRIGRRSIPGCRPRRSRTLA